MTLGAYPLVMRQLVEHCGGRGSRDSTNVLVIRTDPLESKPTMNRFMEKLGVATLDRNLRAFYRERVRRWARGSIVPFAGRVDNVDESTEIGRIFASHDGAQIHKWIHYLSAYAEQFERFRNRPTRFLEIGVSHGGSLELWRKYLGPSAIIFGIDINPNCAVLNGRGGEVRIGSQIDTDFLKSVISDMGGVDVVVDDGSHVAAHQNATFDYLFPLLAVNGLYVVEDLHTAYWPTHGGGYRRRGSFIETTKSLIDDMHLHFHGRPNRVTPKGSAIKSLTYYDSIVFITKGSTKRPEFVSVGNPTF